MQISVYRVSRWDRIGLANRPENKLGSKVLRKDRFLACRNFQTFNTDKYLCFL